ncbi:uncharacterized protein MONBRDRAFT_18981 [Monosiga brevicollis MX1]|uniref:Phosphoribosylformylglycinamidine synthase n=1 Tax=Monosiga brevicollis TaxID=81824 RepID=A9UXN4_MONBE|nr:uncharacterized protein MONBRDRAFT_18981 [Monosiga brevicollis MX1]EDQ89870.1 predicted protein [Monosiga brevicollis MX1]|eukprot:XP_001745292.1 hypothetical protein [Monosiga brevicollis MX1]
MTTVDRVYAAPGSLPEAVTGLERRLRDACPQVDIVTIQTESCFTYQVAEDTALTPEQKERLAWLLREPFTTAFGPTSQLDAAKDAATLIVEVGPRLNVTTAWSTNAVSICKHIGLEQIVRMEQSRRYRISFAKALTEEARRTLIAALYDRMTEFVYQQPLTSFAIDIKPEPVFEVDVMQGGLAALKKASDELGLAFDDWDLDYYTKLFRDVIKRNPTSVECFDMAQSNSEHSRHWFFGGRLVLDGVEQPLSLMKMVKRTQTETQPNNSVIAFHDNSSAIKGFAVPVLRPTQTDGPAPFELLPSVERNLLLTAETHNFPTAVAPFEGAGTGTGGRIRDVQATGRGAHVVAGTAAYCVGNLQIPGYELPWEDRAAKYPNNMAKPLDIEIEASNGASDYGNKFGEPVVAGFTRSFGMTLPSGERREWIKPIMFTSGIGSVEAAYSQKNPPQKGMAVVKVGGPVYRVGMGGGAASSVDVQGGDNRDADLDFSAVQRGDPEMEQKMNRALRACIERADNPIVSIHDQGAGGNGNVLKELVEPIGAEYKVSNFTKGDPTLSSLELWGAEYQENCAMLVPAAERPFLERVAQRERVNVDFVGEVADHGRVVLHDDTENNNGTFELLSVTKPVDLDLQHVLADMPRKVFKSDRVQPQLQALTLPDAPVRNHLDRVLRLLSVGSKRFLTNKVDRSVTGLIAQQQCVGPLHTPLADVAVTALSHFADVGTASAIGEQPIKMLLDVKAGARMSVAEAVANLVFAPITQLADAKCSGNWMWAAKLPGEGAALHDACETMCDTMIALGMALDGGKDSLSMAVKVDNVPVKAPGELVISLYAPCTDVRGTLTPDLKPVVASHLVFVDLAPSHARMGGSALAQVYQQLGNEVPDVDDVQALGKLFATTQQLLKAGHLLAGHDVSDGGVLVAVLEMAFAGNIGLDIALPSKGASSVAACFAEEIGLVLQVADTNLKAVQEAYAAAGLECTDLGLVAGEAQGPDATVVVRVGEQTVVDESLVALRQVWEATSFQLERLQCAASCVEQEEASMQTRVRPPYKLSFTPTAPKALTSSIESRPRVAVVREEGSNGDREMAATLFMAGFNVWDVTMSDLCESRVSLDQFRGLVFVGGFSYADVCGSAKGWAGTALFNPAARAQLEAFRARPDTFSLGVCNGCQLMGLLGWSTETEPANGAVFTHNTSGRYESRFVTVRIDESPAMMLQGMAGSTLGVWVAHGEGRVEFLDADAKKAVETENLAPIRYVDDANEATEVYPLNPNGSPDGIAGLCSADGRHLALMPHPERCSILWQWPYLPEDWRALEASPWLRMFENAAAWCAQNN